MDTSHILADLRAERSRIDRAITALEELDSTGAQTSRSLLGTQAAKKPQGRRRMSAAGRKRIAEAAKKMWAERKKASAPAGRRRMSAATKRKLSQLAKARWAERKRKQKAA